jgi:hypothetical protein
MNARRQQRGDSWGTLPIPLVACHDDEHLRQNQMGNWTACFRYVRNRNDIASEVDQRTVAYLSTSLASPTQFNSQTRFQIREQYKDWKKHSDVDWLMLATWINCVLLVTQ